MKELEKRLEIVDEIYKTCKAINAQGKYYAFFKLRPHVKWVSVEITTVENYEYFLMSEQANYDSDWKTHEKMMIDLTVLYAMLKNYLE